MKSVHCNTRDHEAGLHEAEAVVSRGQGRGHWHPGRGQFFGPQGRGQSEDFSSLHISN